jgi:fermentation-respiration switch protein FrsA (DUF1100 family)
MRPGRVRVGRLAMATMAAAAMLTLLAIAGRPLLLLAWIERDAFVTPPAGTLVPDALGAPSQQLSFASGDRTLRASHVPVPDPRAPALLVFHGDEEDLSRWAAVQHRLYTDGIASFVFDYSGYGASTGRPSVARLRQDDLAACGRFVALTPQAARRVVLGFSLGSAVLLDVAGWLRPAPDGIVVGAGFASAREIAVATGVVPSLLAWALPDVWNSEARVGELAAPPLLIVHSRGDEVVPVGQARRLCEAARGPRRLVWLDGVSHAGPLMPGKAETFWRPVVDFVRSGGLLGAGQAALDEARPCLP